MSETFERNDDWLENIHKGLADVDERMKKALASDMAKLSNGNVMEKSSLPEIKGLELLMEGIYTVDVERTISDMTGIIKNTEAQLDKVLNINSHLGSDLKAAKEMIALLKRENAALKDRISGMEDEIPHKRELQAEIDHLVDERNVAHISLHELRQQLSKAQTKAAGLEKNLAASIEERKDAKKEIIYLENKLNETVEKVNELNRRTSQQYGEIVVQKEKIGKLQTQLKESLDERYKLLKELKDSRNTIKDFRASLSEARMAAKRTFYESSPSEKEGVVQSTL